MELDDFLSRLRIVDTETTGSDHSSELIEIAVGEWKNNEWKIQSSLFKPVKGPIPFEASAINNISNAMVANESTIAESKNIPALLNIKSDSVFVAYNAQFDKHMLDKIANDKLPPTQAIHITDRINWICTYRLAKIAYPDSKQFKLNYLRYMLNLDIGDAVLHRAGADVELCGALLIRLIYDLADLDKLDLKGNIANQLIELSWQANIMDTMPFGKHKGVKFADIPTSYLTWALENVTALNEDEPFYDSDLAATFAQELEKRL